MGSLSDYAEDNMLDHLLEGTALTSPTTVYLALLTADATDAGTGASIAEGTYTGYARKAIAFSAAAARVSTQNGAVTFDACTGGSSDITHWAILDSITTGAGNMLAHGAFNSTVAVSSGKTPSVANAAITVTISSGGASDYCANKILDHLFANTTFTQPTIYAALTTATLVDADDDCTTDITEVVNSNGYTREAVASWNAASAGATANSGTITFGPPSGGNWGTVTSSILTDNASHETGNVLFYANDTVDSAVNDGDTVTFAAGAWDVTLA